MTLCRARRACAPRRGSAHAPGVRPGDRVLLLMRDTPQFAAAWLGAVRAGRRRDRPQQQAQRRRSRSRRADSAPRLLSWMTASRAARFRQVWRRFRPRRSARDAGACGARTQLPSTSPPRHPPSCCIRRAPPAGPRASCTRIAAFVVRAGVSRLRHRRGRSRVHHFQILFRLRPGAWPACDARRGRHLDCPPGLARRRAVIETVRAHRPAAIFSVPTLFRRLLAEPAGRLARLSLRAPLRCWRRAPVGATRRRNGATRWAARFSTFTACRKLFAPA